jgi:hypothetical protein
MNNIEQTTTSVQTFDYDAFISYTRKDGATAASLLYQILKTKNIDSFLDSEKLKKGDYVVGIDDALNTVRNFILIVSESVFASVNVCDEIRFAKEKNIHIIPIFVNGITNYPTSIPENLDFLKTINAYKLNHENFDAQLSKIISELEAKKHVFLNNFTEFAKNSGESDAVVDLFFDVCKNIFDDQTIIKLVSEKIRTHLIATSNDADNSSLTDLILEAMSTDDVKKFAKEYFLIDNRGAHNRVRRNILNWIENKPFDEAVKDESDDRYLDLNIELVIIYKANHEIGRLKDILDKHEIVASSKRSADDLIDALLDSVKSVEELFEKLDLSADETKNLAHELFGTSKRPTDAKNILQERIGKWVNYEYTPDPSECE